MMRRINIRTTIKLFSCVMAVLLTVGCEKADSYLDKAESGGITEDEVFGNYLQTQNYLANIYASGIGPGEFLPIQSSFTYAAATDEAFCPYPRPTSPLTFNNATLSPTNNPVDLWNNLYQNIRKVNRFIQRIDEVPTTTPAQAEGKSRMKGEGYFLRAWFYAGLHKRYGGVPIISRVLSIEEDLNIPRNTAAEVASFIVKDCDSAISFLPAIYPSTELGRATKGAAMMLKARTLLYAASPLHSPVNSPEKWKLAADAAQEVMNLNVYTLDPNYKTLFHTRTSPEVVFQSTINHVWNVTSQDWVRNTQPVSQGGGWGNLQPVQNLVDDYEMKDGSPFDWSNPVHAANPYANRDPRFHMSVIYNDRTWAGSVIKTHVNSGTVDAIFYNNAGSTQTGYYVAKTLDENSSLVGTYKPGSHYWIFMRYTENLLNYAEARNEELGAPDQSIYDAVNMIRQRPGVLMPPLPAGLTKEQMRERIRNERRIELAFENHRFWDVRRWRTGMTEFTDAIGMRITKTGNTYGYEKIVTEKRTYKPAFDLFPIPQSEMEKNKALTQNPGY